MRTTLAGVVALGLTALALAAAGCGGDDGGDQAATTPPAATTPTRPAPTATTPSKGRSAVAVSATEFRFSPSNIDVKAGETTFRLKNDGGAPHALEIEGQGIEEETEVITGGQSTTLKVDLEPGKYEIYCPVGNHRQMGMQGEVTVS
jgi:uncharacterized cupredoxin-like copper-binding protein